MTTLGETEPFYVRCIKPNTLKQSSLFDNELVLAQLKYSGMLETIRIRKMGYPIRYLFKDFLRRYHMILPKQDQSDPIKFIGNILNHVGVIDWQIGTSKVFLREKEVNYISMLLFVFFFLLSLLDSWENWKIKETLLLLHL